MYYDKDGIKNSLDIDQIFQIVENLGGNPQYTSFGFTSDTICHNDIGHGSRKLYCYTNTKLFHCYTECGSLDILELIMRAKSIQNHEEWTLYNAMQYVANLFSLSFEQTADNRLNNVKDDFKILNNYSLISKSKENIELEYKVYQDQILKNLSFIPPASWMNDGITIEAMKRYGIKYYGTEHKIVIPHYNLDGDLIGIRGRALTNEDINLFGKYMPLRINNIMYAHPLSHNLYGLHLNLDNIKRAKRIIIFEAEKSVLLYDSFFGEDSNISVATCGSSLSLFQQDIIKDICGVDEVIIAYDKEFEEIGDSNFKKNVTTLNNLGSKLKNYCNVSLMFDKKGLLDYKDAPIDKGKEVFEKLFRDRIFL